jgi:hypothetical protein
LAARVPPEQLGDERLDLRRVWRPGLLERRRSRARGGAHSRQAQPPLLNLAERLHH